MMFTAFHTTSPRLGGLLWKIPWRLSTPRKRRQRARLRRVDNVVAVLDTALQKLSLAQSQKDGAKQDATAPEEPQRIKVESIERWKREMPTEAEMLPRDKYTVFDRKEKRYRKGVHKIPKWTRVSQRLNPPGF